MKVQCVLINCPALPLAQRIHGLSPVKADGDGDALDWGDEELDDEDLHS